MDELLKKLLATLVEHITTEVSKHQQDTIDAAVAKALDAVLDDRLESALRDTEFTDIKRTLINDVVEKAFEEYDPTDHENFESSVENIINNHDHSDIVKDVINDGSWEISFRG